ncbi:DUF2625 family protein [uncultured Pseudoteredinibacter sp.]|uniref:DUF2625 family protein n=1 Tax=uncultured Pseudoteredinibacter sp. TaxID=1641701 RepID=UPI00260347E4|nr:DUF2625 family protein [uncultured Pseudoteredinibacter sp.]
MKTLEELIDKEDSFINIMNEWISKAKNHVEVLPPFGNRDQVLLDVQVTTRSILGALIYYTGGVLIDHGWIRVLGSGSKNFARNVHGWNQPIRQGIYLVADDAAGGFYAINGGAFSGEMSSVYYWAPDSMEWEPLDLLFSDFFGWLLSGDLGSFYEGLRWDDWESDIQNITTNQCFSFCPPLWTKQGGCNSSHRGVVPIKEALEMKYDFLYQMQENT